MASNLPIFIRQEKNKLLFTGKNKEFVAYIPEKYFDRKIAEQIGEYVELLGIFNYTIRDIETNKNIGLHPFKFPTVFTTKPFVIDKEKQIKLLKNSEPEDYRILRYQEGDEVVSSTDVVKFIGNVEKLLNLWYSLGYINNTIAYDEILEYILDNMDLNGESYGLNTQMIGFTITELCRSTKDSSVPYRLSGSKDLHDYKSMALKNISKHVSPYTAILSDDFNESLIYAMMNETPKDTPLEKILVGEGE